MKLVRLVEILTNLLRSRQDGGFSTVPILAHAALLTLTCVACHGVVEEYCTKHFTATNQWAKSFNSTWLPTKPPNRNLSSVALALNKGIFRQAAAFLKDSFVIEPGHFSSPACRSIWSQLTWGQITFPILHFSAEYRAAARISSCCLPCTLYHLLEGPDQQKDIAHKKGRGVQLQHGRSDRKE